MGSFNCSTSVMKITAALLLPCICIDAWSGAASNRAWLAATHTSVVTSRRVSSHPRMATCVPCDKGTNINGKLVESGTLASLTLRNVRGESQQLQSLIGEKRAVVVFLRHLG